MGIKIQYGNTYTNSSSKHVSGKADNLKNKYRKTLTFKYKVHAKVYILKYIMNPNV